ncbi:MAG: LPS biosynthesis protein [Clostridiaceae bacterium]|nr:LPS biosynthesis protein [Clostridiaceae bacterium]MCI9484952.1 LPS biosynthesis protein [Clostridiaceae bacterium]
MKEAEKEPIMQIDNNELAIRQNELDKQGKKQEAYEMKMEFLRQVREAGDHCPCQEKCPHHGNCFECVTIHRGHRDHLPMCLWDMVNERICALSHITEHTLRDYEDAHKNEP